MVVIFPPELERRIVALAALKRIDPVALVLQIWWAPDVLDQFAKGIDFEGDNAITQF